MRRHSQLAHRVSWFLKHGVWPKLHVLHTCDNPGCVNPDHLFEGTNADNVADKMAKGRQYAPKLNPEKAVAIYKAKGTLKQIAAAYGVADPMVWRIKHRRVWANATRCCREGTH